MKRQNTEFKKIFANLINKRGIVCKIEDNKLDVQKEGAQRDGVLITMLIDCPPQP